MAAGLAIDGEALGRAQRSAAAVFAIRVAGAGLAYGTQVLMARLMGQADYGVFALVWVWIAILGHGSLWGVGQAVCRLVPAYRVRGELALARGFLAGGAAFALASGLLTAGVGGLVLWAGADRLGAAQLWPFALALLVLPLFALQDYVEGVARSFNWAGLAIAPIYLVRQGLIAAAMVAAVLAGLPAEPWVAIACTLLATAAALVLQTALLLARLRRALPAGPRTYRPRDWAAATLPIGLVDLAAVSFSFVDVILVGLLLPPEAVGAYFAATRILQFVVFVQFAASAATAQRFAETAARADRATLAALVTRTARLSALATLAIGASVLAAAPWLLALFGPGFAAGLVPLAILVAGIVAQTAFGPGEDVLTMTGAGRLCALVSLAALLFAVILGLALIPPFGLVGAAAAMALAWAGRGLALCTAARLRLGVVTHVGGP
jgi:O-antigen/teichoic acid export membrane protein